MKHKALRCEQGTLARRGAVAAPGARLSTPGRSSRRTTCAPSSQRGARMGNSGGPKQAEAIEAGKLFVQRSQGGTPTPCLRKSKRTARVAGVPGQRPGVTYLSARGGVRDASSVNRRAGFARRAPGR